MLPRNDNGVIWMQGGGDGVSWRNNGVENKKDMVGSAGGVSSLSSFKSLLEEEWYLSTTTSTNNNMNNSMQNQSHHQDFQTMQNHQDMKELSFTQNPISGDNLLMQQLDSSSSCSPSSVFSLDPSQVHSYLPSNKSSLSSLLNVVCNNNPFENGFDLGFEPGFLMGNHASTSPVLMSRGNGLLTEFSDLNSQEHLGSHDLSSNSQFGHTHLLQLSDNSGTSSNPIGFGGFESSALLSHL